MYIIIYNYFYLSIYLSIYLSGDGDSCILSDDEFRHRLTVVKKCVDENEYLQVQVLNAVKISMEHLKHPPSKQHFPSCIIQKVVSWEYCDVWQYQTIQYISLSLQAINYIA